MSSLDKNLAAVSSEARLVLIGLDCVKVQKLVILVRVQIDPCMPPLLSTGQLCIAAFVPNEKMINFVP